jgi:membrane protease YdiL (CAAX protease family)
MFGLMHMSNVVASDQQMKKTMLQTLSATIGGLIAGWSYMYTNSILTPIMSHMINNIIATGLDSIEYSVFYTKNSN